MQLEVSNQYPNLSDPTAATQALVECLQNHSGFSLPPAELSIAFVTDSVIADVHAQFMDDPTPTDVITFPADSSMGSAGEILVSVDHALARSKELKLPFAQELSLYLAHGWLHLKGFNDTTPAEREAMRDAEKQALKALGQWHRVIDFKIIELPENQ